ncbi:hypothetical protein A3D88_02370 [Candidatus Peribacteria bacterium RIFCSPHIGHO2_02_FULL_52_16]|nr:MAG: hypothetical protein A2706_00195 [Candidatus Peribacteria bacterium RIFCSPHIGHO2_01_FULL_51_35]OGJ61608.1 MAG: hypothetical protein A3D88_02370 [Candidatus Peribacteria bacterium RIFCSPHIGHO2_02_FULL_52_16]
MDSIRSLLPKVLRKRGLHAHAEASLVVHRSTLWIREQLPALAADIHVEKLQDATLIIRCKNSVAAQECQMLASKLKTYLEQECGITVKEVCIMRA